MYECGFNKLFIKIKENREIKIRVLPFEFPIRDPVN